MGHRRCWTDDEKVRSVEESRRDGVTLTEVARWHEISRPILYDWRCRHKLGLLGWRSVQEMLSGDQVRVNKRHSGRLV